MADEISDVTADQAVSQQPYFGGPPIESPDAAETAMSEEEKEQAEADAAAAAAAEAADPTKRFVQYVVPKRAAGKVVSRPSTEPHAYASRAAVDTVAAQVGVASAVARIHPHHFEQLGIEAPSDTVVWNFDNNWRVPASRFSAAALDYLLTNDNRFELVDGSGKKVDR